MATQVSITRVKRAKEWLRVSGPFHPGFVDGARKLRGRWLGKEEDCWEFDARVEPDLRQLCFDTYGTDGRDVPTVTAVVFLDKIDTYCQSVWALGRQLVWRPGRDSRVRLGEGVTVLEGGFPARGGSHNYPAANANEGTTLRVWDVPLPCYRKDLEKNPEAFQLVEVPVVEFKSPATWTERVEQLLVRIMDEGDSHSNALALEALKEMREALGSEVA